MAVLLRLNTFGGYLAGALLWSLAGIVFLDVAARSLGAPLLWANEVSTYLLVALVFLGAGHTYDRNGHFAINHLIANLPRVQRLGLELATVVVSLGLSILFAWGGIELVRFARSLSLASPTLLQVPLYVPYSAIIIGGISLSISLVVRAVTLITALRENGDVAEREETSI